MNEARQVLKDIDSLSEDSIFDAHEELRERSLEFVKFDLNGVPTMAYRFADGSALSLSCHSDYWGNIRDFFLHGGFDKVHAPTSLFSSPPYLVRSRLRQAWATELQCEQCGDWFRPNSQPPKLNTRTCGVVCRSASNYQRNKSLDGV
jgi:hypothetical protein